MSCASRRGAMGAEPSALARSAREIVKLYACIQISGVPRFLSKTVITRMYLCCTSNVSVHLVGNKACYRKFIVRVTRVTCIIILHSTAGHSCSA